MAVHDSLAINVGNSQALPETYNSLIKTINRREDFTDTIHLTIPSCVAITELASTSVGTDSRNL